MIRICPRMLCAAAHRVGGRQRDEQAIAFKRDCSIPTAPFAPKTLSAKDAIEAAINKAGEPVDPVVREQAIQSLYAEAKKIDVKRIGETERPGLLELVALALNSENNNPIN